MFTTSSLSHTQGIFWGGLWWKLVAWLMLCDLHLGGFEGFSEAYPDLCYNSASNHLPAVEPEPTATGRTTPAYDQVRHLFYFI